jgi:hypothetical protein
MIYRMLVRLVWNRLLLPMDDPRIIQLTIAARGAVPAGHQVAVYGFRSGGFWVRDMTARRTVMDVRGLQSYDACMSGLMVMAAARSGDLHELQD